MNNKKVCLGHLTSSSLRSCIINDFLTDLFGDQEGIVYSPIKGDKWEQHFFAWPQERDKLEEHISSFNSREVYISPVMFKERLKTPDGKRDATISPENFKGSHYVWTEFDGATPQDAITPTMRVASSIEGHEHWYWKLDKFETDKTLIEDVTRRIAFHYGADLSAWDYQQVLRPVDTWNHKRNKPVTLKNKSNVVYSLEHFLKSLPIPPAGTKIYLSDKGELPSKEEILAKYKFTGNGLDLLFKIEIPKGKRSDALVALAHECAESGLSNDEIYVLLTDRDDIWGKFVGRDDRQKRLEGIIASVRRRNADSAEIFQEAPEVYRFQDFMRTNINLKWVIPGLLPVAGSMVIFGKPGIGKSTFSLRLAIDLALGREKFLLWDILAKQRVMFVSLEMQHAELKEFFKDMKLSDREEAQLQSQLFIWPVGNAYPFDVADQQAEIVKYIKMHKIELIIIDSLALSMYGAVTSDDDVKRLNSFLNEDIRKGLKCGYMFIHHPRKQSGAEAKDGEEDLFGSIYISANAQTVIYLKSRLGSNKIHVKLKKTRMTLGSEDFYIERTNDRGFKLADSKPVTTVITDSGETTSDKKPANGSLGKLFEI